MGARRDGVVAGREQEPRLCVWRRQGPLLFSDFGADQARLLPVPVPFLFGFALVELFLALGKADADFHAALHVVQVEGHQRVTGALHLADQLGDFFGVLAALFWAATTVLIRATSLARVTATKVLLYQLVVSAAVMFPLSWLVGERGIGVVSAPTLWAMAYQVVIVAFASYLAWFWLLTRYLAGRLLVFSFLTPLFGVGFGMVLMSDRPSLHFILAAAMVVGGIVMVNMPSRK